MKKAVDSIKKHRIIAVILAVVMLAVDQITKLAAKNTLSHNPDSVTVIPGVIDFRYLENPGAAFGWFSNHRWVFMLLTTFFLCIALYAFFKIKITSKFINYALMLIISGGVGNMIDRIFRGDVIDFINFSFVNFYVFNIADCCVVIGCAMFILYLVKDTFSSPKSDGEKNAGKD